MRRKNREVTNLSEIIEIMKNCDVCRLALNDDGFPYILPLNFGMAVNGDKITLYFIVLWRATRSGLSGRITELHLKWTANMSCNTLRTRATAQWHTKA